MNAMILLAQGAMNMADSLATANPVLTEVGTPEMNMLDMAIKGGWIMVVLGVLSVVCFYILFERNYMIRKAGKEDPMFMEPLFFSVPSSLCLMPHKNLNIQVHEVQAAP